MHDPRFEKLSDILTNHSTKIQPGELVLVECIDTPREMVIALIRAVRKAGGMPILEIKDSKIHREMILGADEAGIKHIATYEAFRMENVHVYIGIRGSGNIAEMSDLPPESLQQYENLWLQPVHYAIRIPHTRWVVLPWPNEALAQKTEMSTEAFEDYYFTVCTKVDYTQMARAMGPLKTLMEETDEVHIVGEGTDLQFSIKDISASPCVGEINLPDGECFTAPVWNSANGTIRFNTPTTYYGVTFTDIQLRFENGKVIEAAAKENIDILKGILDIDTGARFIGEFSIGLNPYITKPSLDFFNEKIAGSCHIALGQAYEEADNGVRSAIHLSLVMIQTLEYGGGEIYFDKSLVRKDGWFVHPALQELNPDKLY